MAFSLKEKNHKKFKEILPRVTKPSAPIVAGNQKYVPESPLKKEKLMIFKSKVLLPFTIVDNLNAFMGSISNPSRDTAIINEFFPTYHHTKPKVSENKPIDLAYLFRIARVFCSAPLVNVDYVFG